MADDPLQHICHVQQLAVGTKTQRPWHNCELLDMHHACHTVDLLAVCMPPMQHAIVWSCSLASHHRVAQSQPLHATMWSYSLACQPVVLQPCMSYSLACHHVVLQPCMPLCGLTALHATMWSYSLACHSVVLQPCTPVDLQTRAKLCHHVVLSWHATVWSYSCARLSTCRHMPSGPPGAMRKRSSERGAQPCMPTCGLTALHVLQP